MENAMAEVTSDATADVDASRKMDAVTAEADGKEDEFEDEDAPVAAVASESLTVGAGTRWIQQMLDVEITDGLDVVVLGWAMMARHAVTSARQLHADIFVACAEMEMKKVSRLEREDKGLADRSLVYGEIPFETVDAIFSIMRSDFGALMDRGGNFYDIGSGCGKVVLAAALLHDFSKCCGFEVLHGLHAVAIKALEHWRYKTLDVLPASKGDMDVGFVRADAAQTSDWRDATLIFCNSTCFSDSLMQALANTADKVPIGAYFVAVSKPLPSKKWSILLERKLAMSWGNATVIIHKKVL